MHIYIFIDIIFIIKKEVLTCVRFFFREVVSTLDVAESAGPSKSWKRVTKARFRWSISSRPLSPEKTTHTTSVKCLWEVFVWGVVLVVYVCVCRCRGCCSLSVCVCVPCWSFNNNTHDQRVSKRGCHPRPPPVSSLHIYIYIYIYIVEPSDEGALQVVHQLAALIIWGNNTHDQRVGLYKILVYVQAVVHESTVLSFPPPTCIVHLGAIFLHVYWTV